MMDYSKKFAYSCQPKDTIEMASGLLVQAGLSITRKKESSIEFASPGYNSTKQHPLRGVSKGVLSVSGSQIKLKADLDGLLFLQWFVYILPLGISALIGSMLFVVFLSVFSIGIALMAMGIAVLCYLPWLYFSSLISRIIRRKTEKALDQMVIQVAQS